MTGIRVLARADGRNMGIKIVAVLPPACCVCMGVSFAAVGLGTVSGTSRAVELHILRSSWGMQEHKCACQMCYG